MIQIQGTFKSASGNAARRRRRPDKLEYDAETGGTVETVPKSL